MTKKDLIEALRDFPDFTEIVVFQDREPYSFWAQPGWESPDGVLYGDNADDMEMLKDEGYTTADCKRVYMIGPD